jgi:hypothetical protein
MNNLQESSIRPILSGGAGALLSLALIGNKSLTIPLTGIEVPLAVGYFTVIGGSTLGGQVLQHYISPALGLPEKGSESFWMVTEPLGTGIACGIITLGLQMISGSPINIGDITKSVVIGGGCEMIGGYTYNSFFVKQQ